jgi:hypothetical protein
LPDPLLVGRYHSLVVDGDSLPRELEVTARTEDGTVMAFEHRDWPVVGLQFHPESILTEHGYEMLAAFLRRAGLVVSQPLPSISSERPAIAQVPAMPTVPVTF